jgi:membrane protein YqaA with SNARE-associated domain
MVNETIVNETVSVVAQNNTIGDAMIYITNKLGVASTQLIEIYARVQAGVALVEFASTMAFWISLVALITWFIGRKLPNVLEVSKEYNRAYYDDEINNAERERREIILVIKTIGYLLLTILTPIALSVLINATGVMVLKILYPDYFAIQTLLGQFQTFVK